MSGVVENYWAMSEHNDHVELAYKIAADFGEPKETIDELVEFLKSVPAEKLCEYNNIAPMQLLFPLSSTPVIESESSH